MKRVGGIIAVAVFVACGELREAQPGADAGSPDASTSKLDGGTSGGPDSHDAATDKDAEPAPCPAPCEPELISKLDNLGALVVDSFNAYFASGNGGVFKVSKTGGTATKLGDGKTTRIALANNRLFWGEGDHLVACVTGGCNGIPEGLLLNQTGIDEVMSDGTQVVWHMHVGANDFIRRCPVNNCAQGSVVDITDVTSPRAGMGVGAGKVFWTDVSSKLFACPLDPTPCLNPVTIGPGSNDAVVAGTDVYWVNDENVVTCPITGCSGAPKIIGGSASPHLLVADERHLYWREMVDNKVLRCPLAGCTGDPEVIADEVNGIYYGGLALDGDYVYWTAKSGLWRRHK